MHRRYLRQHRDRDHHLGHRLDAEGSYRHRLGLHPDVELRHRNLDEVHLLLQLDVVRPDAVLHHQLDEAHLDEERRHHYGMERKDCFHPDVLPDEEFPFPDLPRMGCYPDAGCLELAMEELELEVTVLQKLVPQFQTLEPQPLASP